MQHRAAIKNLAFIFTSLSESAGKSLASRETLLQWLASIERLAFAYRQWGELRNVGNILTGSPLPDPIKAIGFYYLGHTANPLNTGDVNAARSLLSVAIEEAPGPYRARALVSLACQAHFAENREQAVELNLKAAAAASRAEDLYAAIDARQALAILDSLEGNHRRALDQLDSLWPMVRAIQRQSPVIYYDWLNSVAVELGELGRTSEAHSAAAIVTASPFAEAYPEWLETAQEIQELAERPSLIVVQKPQPQARRVQRLSLAFLSSVIRDYKLSPIRRSLALACTISFILARYWTSAHNRAPPQII